MWQQKNCQISRKLNDQLLSFWNLKTTSRTDAQCLTTTAGNITPDNTGNHHNDKPPAVCGQEVWCWTEPIPMFGKMNKIQSCSIRFVAEFSNNTNIPNIHEFHENITSNYWKTIVKGVRIWIFEWAIVNRFQLIYDDDWSSTSMDTRIGSPTFYTWVFKSIY